MSHAVPHTDFYVIEAITVALPVIKSREASEKLGQESWGEEPGKELHEYKLRCQNPRPQNTASSQNHWSKSMGKLQQDRKC